MSSSTETIEAFIARGGEIRKVKAAKAEGHPPRAQRFASSIRQARSSIAKIQSKYFAEIERKKSAR